MFRTRGVTMWITVSLIAVALATVSLCSVSYAKWTGGIPSVSGSVLVSGGNSADVSGLPEEGFGLLYDKTNGSVQTKTASDPTDKEYFYTEFIIETGSQPFTFTVYDDRNPIILELDDKDNGLVKIDGVKCTLPSNGKFSVMVYYYQGHYSVKAIAQY